MKKLFSKWLSALLIAALLLPCVAVAEGEFSGGGELTFDSEPSVFEADAPEAVEPESEEPIVEDVIDEPDAAPAEDAAPVEDAEEGESASDEDPDAPVEEVIIDSVDEIVSEDDFADLPAEDFEGEEQIITDDGAWETTSSEAMYEGEASDDSITVHPWEGLGAVTVKVNGVETAMPNDGNALVITANEGDTIVIAATPAEGYCLISGGIRASYTVVNENGGWWYEQQLFDEEGSSAYAETQELAFTKPAKAVDVSVTFVRPSGYSVTLYQGETEYGTYTDESNPEMFSMENGRFCFTFPAVDLGELQPGERVAFFSNAELDDTYGVYHVGDKASVYTEWTSTFYIGKHTPKYHVYGNDTLSSDPEHGFKVTAFVDGQDVTETDVPGDSNITVSVEVGTKMTLRGLRASWYDNAARKSVEVSLEKTGDATYSLIMPDSSVSFWADMVQMAPEGQYKINIQPTEHGTVFAMVQGLQADSADQNVFVNIGNSADEGYAADINNLKVMLGDSVYSTSTGFTMPAGDITVILPFKEKKTGGAYAINISPYEHGTVYAQFSGQPDSTTTADAGDSIHIVSIPDMNYMSTGVTVTDQNGNVINGYSGTGMYDPWTFTMPDGPVTVTVKFIYSVNIIVNEENFPDANLRARLIPPYGPAHMEGPDYVVSSGNVSYLSLENVTDYTGLELLTNLNRLEISGDQLTTLKLEHDTVTSIMFANCENLTSVDLSGCPNLNDVNFEWNTPKIASLDVSGCTKLTQLQARGAALTKLDVSHNTELVKLDCNSNKLTELDVSNNTKLETLRCYSNNIKELNLAKNPRILAFVNDTYKQNINDTQEGYTCIAYVNPDADPWDAWVLAHDHGVEITLAPVFAIATTVADNGASGTIDAPASASANQTVTVTLTPDENSVAGEIKVAFGETEVPATFADGKYTFTMPEGDVAITATFKKRPKVEAPVAAENLTYDGSEQALVVAGTTDGGTLQYSLDGEAWSEDIPVGKAAGDYEVYYRVLGNGDFGDYAAEAPVAVAIAKAKATVTIDKKKTYGDNDPDTSDYTVDGLVSGDTLTGDPEREKGENVKRYAYNAGNLDNPNYDITVEGNLTILPKEISAFEWSTDPFTYNGEAQLPTATVSEGLVEGDECSVTVVAKDGDDATEAGDHTAVVVSLSNGNYKLPKTAIEHTYTIEKADHEDVKDGVQFAVSANGVENGQADLTQYIPEGAEWFVTGCDNKLITAAEIKTGDEKSRILTYTAIKAAADVTEGCVELEIKEKDYNPYDLIVKFVTSEVFTLSFDSKGGEPVESLKLHQGVPYGELPKLARDYYTFKGWVDSANNTVTPETEMGAGDTTIFAKWVPIKYTIALDNGEHGTIPIEYLNGEIPFTIESDAFDLPKLEDVEGYTFSGWKLGDEIAYTDVRIDPAEALKTMPEDNTIRYTAQWVAGNTVGKVAFAEPDDVLSGILGIKDMDAEASTDGESNSNSLAETLKQVAADNSDSEIPDGCESRTITVEMQVSATGIREEDKGLILKQVGEPAVKDVDVKTDFLKIDINQTTSYTAAEGGNTQDPETTTLTDLNRVVEIPLNYDMTGRYNLRLFRKHGDSVEPFTKLSERPRSGKDMQDGTFFVSGYGASAVIYIYSDRFSTFAASTDNRESFEVNFVSNGGSEVAAQTVYKNDFVTKPADPTRAATDTVVYTFDGWYTDEALTEKYDFDATPVTETFTLYARWIETAVANNTAPTTTAPAPAPAPAPEANPILTIISNKKNVKATVEVGKVYQIDLLGKSGKGYKSSKKKLATVSSTGLVTPKNVGKVKITFKVGKKKRTITLKVVDPTVPKSIALSLAGTVPAKVGEPQTLTYTLPAGSESGVKWKTSNKKIATVNNGVVTFKKAGTVTITATCTRGKKKAKVKFKVSK